MNNPWTKVTCAKDTYVTEASDLSATEEDANCPKCGTEVFNNQWRVEKNSDGEIQMWVYMCSCGTTMKVFND